MGARGDYAVAIVKVLQRGQLTLPKALRDRVGMAEGDDLLVYVTGDGRIVMEVLPRTRSLTDLMGSAKPVKPLDIEDARRKARSDRARRRGLNDGMERALAQVAATTDPEGAEG